MLFLRNVQAQRPDSQYFPCSEEEEISQINVQAAYPSGRQPAGRQDAPPAFHEVGLLRFT
jgi:hypothetical protein